MAPLLVVLACRSGEEAGSGDAAGEGEPAAVAPPAGPGAGDTAGGAGDTAGGGGDASSADGGAAPLETAAAGGASESERGASGGGEPAAGGGEAGAAGDVVWMRVDEAAKRVEFDIVAGLTTTNGNWNFNGYANGDLTITVPKEWSVMMNFTNHDGDVPHSLYFRAEGPPYPDRMPDGSAIPRAYSINLMSGIGAGVEDVLRFPVPRAGRFSMVCGVPGHAKSGMYDWFIVSEEATRPTVSTES